MRASDDGLVQCFMETRHGNMDWAGFEEGFDVVGVRCLFTHGDLVREAGEGNVACRPVCVQKVRDATVSTCRHANEKLRMKLRSEKNETSDGNRQDAEK